MRVGSPSRFEITYAAIMERPCARGLTTTGLATIGLAWGTSLCAWAHRFAASMKVLRLRNVPVRGFTPSKARATE